jgi:hypothetical protein
MRKTTLVGLVVLGCAAAVAAADSRTLTGSVPAATLKVLTLDSSIGDVEITAVEGAREVTIEVQLTPRRGGFFSSKRQAEREVQEAVLSTSVEGSKLDLHISPAADGDRRFEEDWRIELPPDLAIEIDHGVGDIVIRNTASRVEIDSGVGDVKLEILSGVIAVDLGVGTAAVRAPAEPFAIVRGESGVGDATIMVGGERIAGDGFLGKSASWNGSGSESIEVSVGVGDVVITLD